MIDVDVSCFLNRPFSHVFLSRSCFHLRGATPMLLAFCDGATSPLCLSTACFVASDRPTFILAIYNLCVFIGTKVVQSWERRYLTLTATMEKGRPFTTIVATDPTQVALNEMRALLTSQLV